jgi:hypothetical protein
MKSKGQAKLTSYLKRRALFNVFKQHCSFIFHRTNYKSILINLDNEEFKSVWTYIYRKPLTIGNWHSSQKDNAA